MTMHKVLIVALTMCAGLPASSYAQRTAGGGRASWGDEIRYLLEKKNIDSTVLEKIAKVNAFEGRTMYYPELKIDASGIKYYRRYSRATEDASRETDLDGKEILFELSETDLKSIGLAIAKVQVSVPNEQDIIGYALVEPFYVRLASQKNDYSGLYFQYAHINPERFATGLSAIADEMIGSRKRQGAIEKMGREGEFLSNGQ